VSSGIDGCKSGWIVSSIHNKKLSIQYYSSLDNVKLLSTTNIIIDMPVTCPKTILNYPRNADKKAKSFLGRNHASIFYAPVTHWLKMNLNAINKECQLLHKPKLSIQSYNLFSKIKEVNRSRYYNYLWESHPECVFKRWNNNMSLPSKKTVNGRLLREKILYEKLKFYGISNFISIIDQFKSQHSTGYCNDDIFDSLSMAILGIEKKNKQTIKYFSKNFLY
tara:strand:- start:1 stop:663 length:663 start_codon:yes stop_codon:yes gene_type:complete